MAKKLKPEKIVEKDIVSAAKQLGLDLSIVESKASFSENQQQYRAGETESGFPDLCGNTPDGIAVFVELKARGKCSAIRPHQRRFLLRKAEAGCFAVCVDREEMLVDLYLRWKRHGKEQILHHLHSL